MCNMYLCICMYVHIIRYRDACKMTFLFRVHNELAYYPDTGPQNARVAAHAGSLPLPTHTHGGGVCH